jgi:hypothetical protein
MNAKTSDFIERAKQVHGNKYDYTKVNYTNNRTKIMLVCPKHGDVEMTPRIHLLKGCGKCKHGDKFIQKSQSVHGDKYDYSKVVYINSLTKVTIVCCLHGEFPQMPPSHLLGNGCPSCAGKNKDTESFIEQARKVHEDKYDYSKVIYVNTRLKVIIICPKHNKEFPQTPNHHLKGVGCPTCALERRHRCSHEEFMTKIKAKHGDKYDYSKTKYAGSKNEIIIICKSHGEFSQCAGGHLRGNECPTCAGKEKLTTKVFIERAKAKHGSKYDYSKVDYINIRTKIKIICPAKFDTGMPHGEFDQGPDSHLSGSGCPKCNLCPSCGIWRAYGGRKCGYCDPSLQNSHYVKTKEYAVVKYLKENLPDYDFIHNKSVGKDCTNGHLFPDIRYDRGFYSLIVEIDEHKHRGADYKCDEQRMYDIIAKLMHPCIFIRYNPDGKKSDKNTLLDKIKQYIEIDPENKPYVWDENSGLKCEYLFY